jgi:DNA-binding response OmpR family regulator
MSSYNWVFSASLATSIIISVLARIKIKQGARITIYSQKKRMKRILVDDEYDISLTIKVVLEENGLKVDSFNDASQALGNFIIDIYDLVILDVLMQGMSGFGLYNEIRKLDDKVPICFLTAADESYYEALKESHPNIDESCIIHKPVDNDSLLRQIKSMM